MGHGERIPRIPFGRYALAHDSSNPQSLRDSPGGARGKDSPNPLRSLRASRTIHPTPSPYGTAPVGHGERIPRIPFGRYALRARFIQPPVPTGQPRWGTGKGFPESPSVATRFAHDSSNPQSLRDSPGGARGKDSPNPLRSLRASRTIHPTPSPYGTAPVGHGERIPRIPFGRYAPNTHILSNYIPDNYILRN